MSDVDGPEGSEEFRHQPVQLHTVVELFAPVPTGWVVDATVGGGGHSAALLEAHPHLSVLGLDRDEDAVRAAGRRLGPFGARARVCRARFDGLGGVVDEQGTAPVTGVLFDLGVSSPQVDRAGRGFSFRHDGPLDMRMDRSQPTTAADLVNGSSVDELARTLATYGDERYALRIARSVVRARPVTTTGQLAEIVRDAIPAPARRRGGHPARRTFQALRIAVNDELAVLERGLDAALDVLAPRGRCVVIAYHSGEDRIVKSTFRRAATGGWTGPAHLPPPPEIRPTVRLLRAGAAKPTAEEVAANPRAESARLRAVEKLPEETP